MECRSSFDVFKSSVCHQVKDMGDLDFVMDFNLFGALQSIQGIRNAVFTEFKGALTENFLLLGLVDKVDNKLHYGNNEKI